MRRDSLPPMLPLVIAATGGLLFVASLLYFAVSFGWLWDAERPAPGAPWRSAAIDVALFTLFAAHHSAFARSGAKAWIRRTIDPVLERSVYVWIASVLFILICALWLPIPWLAWRADGAWRIVLYAGQAAAGVFTILAARRLDVLELAGVRQVLRAQAGQRSEVARGPTSAPEAAPRLADSLGAAAAGALDDTGPYGVVRHPIYLAWIALVWLAPTMNGTRLVFAAVSTAYLLAAIPFEERDLRRVFGEAYSAYSRKIRWRVLPFVY